MSINYNELLAAKARMTPELQSSAFPTAWPGDHATPPIGRGFSKIVPAPPGCADEVRSRPFTVMDARGVEYGRENALMRGSTERTDRYTQGIR